MNENFVNGIEEELRGIRKVLEKLVEQTPKKEEEMIKIDCKECGRTVFSEQIITEEDNFGKAQFAIKYRKCVHCGWTEEIFRTEIIPVMPLPPKF